MDGPEHWHWGWESPTCELRGHMMGHWLSAAARIYAQTGDGIVKSKADAIVEGLGQCQSAIGTGWLAAFPETYMHRAANGKWVWAPHYTVHKLLMGLHEMYALAGNQQALAIMTEIADWFYQWSGEFDREEMDDLLDIETIFLRAEERVTFFLLKKRNNGLKNRQMGLSILNRLTQK
ncbi:beta-L-arabinofuranosidase domain-containing protein [Paenibacillus sp. FSL H8-0537]|uniref:beta-L-arabinofuranosidase domain-containing protein n=1 Tax=Paenibacillus sp. FSL H8-0537 TaxID=2921399 RepID=UPI003100DA7D